MKTIRWGIIGCGNVTEVKSGPGFQKARNSSLSAVMRRDGEKAREYAERHHVPRWYSDADALLGDPEVDAIYVATPPGSHMEYALKAIAAGKPVYVEKPMARSHDECQRMTDAASEAGVPLYVAYYRRALPRFLKVKELIDAGAVGEVRFAHCMLHHPPEQGDLQKDSLPWRVQPELAGGGRFLDLGSHTLDILDFILGPIAEADGQAGNQAGLYPAEDIVNATWRHESGVYGGGTWCFTSGMREDLNQIAGTEGTLKFSTFGNEPVRLERPGRDATEYPTETPEHIQQPLIQQIVDDLVTGSRHCSSTGVSGARTSWVMDEILRSWRAQ